MKIDSSLRSQLTTAFAPINDQPPIYPFPEPDSLARSLRTCVPKKSQSVKHIDPAMAQMFITAAVNMWMRAVHSFLISVSLTKISPIWSSVSGYYSSHYSVRAIAHLLGSFRLFSRGYNVTLTLQGAQYICNFQEKRDEREHQYYWRIVKLDQHFATDPFFTQGLPQDGSVGSVSKQPKHKDNMEVDHRDWAQYIDHLQELPEFEPLEKDALRENGLIEFRRFPSSSLQFQYNIPI